jgi:hypothetical protein
MDLQWRKSSFSAVNNCLEVAWRKSSKSNPSGNSVEARAEDGLVHVRESDDPGIVVTTTPEKWAAFIEGVKAGEFDL